MEEVDVARGLDRFKEVQLAVTVALEAAEGRVANLKRAGAGFECAEGIGDPGLERGDGADEFEGGTGWIGPLRRAVE